MLKKLFDFKLSKPLLIAKIVMLVCFVAAIVVTWFGLMEIMDAKHMKEVLDMSRPTMGAVLGYLVLGFVIAGSQALMTHLEKKNKKKEGAK